jgi:hypothetical protein
MENKMKFLCLLASLLFFSNALCAERNKDFLDYGAVAKNTAYEQLLSGIPFATDLPKSLKNPKSITYQYYTKNGEYFNHVPLKYFVENTENLKGVYSTFILTPNITELDEKYELLKKTNNIITRNKIEKNIYELYQKNTKNYDLEFLRQYDYYSEVSVKGAMAFNLDEKKQELVLDSKNIKSIELNFYCDEYGNKFAYLYANEILMLNTFTLDSYVQNTPIFFSLSSEIKESLAYFKNRKKEKICKYTKIFQDIDFAEKYINSISNPKDKLIVTFSLDEKQLNRSYLIGKIKHLILTKYDDYDGYIKPLDITTSINFDNDLDIPIHFADKYLTSHVKNKSFETEFKDIVNSSKHTFSLNNDDLYFNFKTPKEAIIFSNKNRFYATYDVTYDKKEIVLILKKIKREYKQGFPNKVRILYVKNIEKQENYESTKIVKEFKKYSLFLLSNNDFEYKEHDLNFKEGFIVNMNEIDKVK